MKIRLRDMAHGLSGRTLLLVLGSILTFVAVLSLLLFSGTGRLLNSWHEREIEALHSFIQGQLSALALEARKDGRTISEAETARALEGLPYSPSWVVVTAPDGRLLYFYREADPGGQSRNFLRRLQDISEWFEVRLPDGTLAFKYSALIPAFDEQESNRILLGALRLVLVWGSAAAALLAFVFAWIFVRPLRRQTAGLVASLERMAAGERGVALPSCPVTEIDHIARASDVLQTNLQREEELRRQWAADIAHDLRTPLAVLRGQLEGMLDGVFAPVPDRINRLVSELRKLESLVNALALLSRIETPGFRPERAPIDIRSILSGTAERFGPEARAAGSEIVVEAPAVRMEADAALLERALENLVSNALRYGRPGGRIVLAARNTAPAGVTLSVENDGVIDPEILPRVFDRLFRADDSRGAEGRGLGLSIVKAIVEAHGGAVRAESDGETAKTRFIATFT